MKELVRTTCIPLQLLFPVQFFQYPVHSLSGSLKYITSFQNFTAFLWHAAVFPYFTQNFSLERKYFLPRLLFSSVLLISLESELSLFNWALKSTGHKLNLALASSWVIFCCSTNGQHSSYNIHGITHALINSLKAYLYQLGMCLWVVFSIYMQLPLGFNWAYIQH